MKIQNIYHLLQAALLLLLVSCTQEEFPAVQDKAQQLTISVTDGGYTSAVENMKTRVETRAVENGYTTEFTEGDACGFYMVRGGKPVYSNVKLTAEKDAATGGIMWKTDGTTLAAGMDGEYRRWGQGYIQQPRLVLFVFGALEVPHMVLDFEQLPRHGALHLGK